MITDADCRVELDESISGSESSGSDSESEADGGNERGNKLNALVNKQLKLEDNDEEENFGKRRKRGAGKPPLLWFKSNLLPSNTSLGIYRAIFSASEQQDSDLVQIVRNKQLSPLPQAVPRDSDGGVPLPQVRNSPHIFLCMIGGGHFAGMIVSLAPKYSRKQGGLEERQATVIAHKTFHRYTTRRKQGGSQSANDNAKGNAHSAGAGIRRYNEVALETEIRALLAEWKDLIKTSELLFVRATGTTNRRVLFGPYEGQVLRQDDPRNRGFPFSTRRATQAELMRCFVELTRVKVSEVDEAALEAARLKALEEDAQKEAAAAKVRAMPAKTAPARSAEDEAALLHTTQIEALIRRSKVPALLSYITANNLSPDFLLYPTDSQAHYHAPTMLHLSGSINSPALITALLVKANADPTLTSREGKTAFEIAGDRSTRDAFRLARSSLGESKWPWDAAHIPEPLTKSEIDERNERERIEQLKEEESRREAEMARIKEEEKRRTEERKRGIEERREKKMGKGRKVEEKPLVTAEERREEETRGMTPEMRMRFEREKRARAAEERMRRLAGEIGGAGTGAGR